MFYGDASDLKRLAPRSDGRIPVEFIGLARLFRSAVRAEDIAADKVLAAIRAPLRERLQRKPVLRSEHAIEAERAWRAGMPATFRLGEIAVRREAKAIGIGERRVTTSWLHDDRWNNTERERGVSVAAVLMLAVRGKVTETWSPIAAVSLHALARIERSGWRDHAALIEALAVLVDAPDEVERVDTARGFWLGGVVDAMVDGARKGCRMRSVRTWLAVQKPWIVPIPGTTKLHRLQENLAAVNVALTPGDLHEISMALATIQVQGERLPEDALKMTGR